MGILTKLSRKKHTANGKLSSVLMDEKQKSAVIVNSIDDAVVLIDTDNTIQMFNPAAAALTGWSQEEANTIDYRSVIKLVNDKGEPYADNQHPFYKVFELNKTLRDNTGSLIRKDSKSVSVDISISPLVSSNGFISGAIGVFRNVDEQRKEERKRADFISTASHEMRTPVAAIEGYLALAMNDKVCQIDAKARNYLEKAHTSTNHLGQLFQDLLTSAKAEDGRLTSHPRVINMSEYIEQLVEDLKFSAEKKGLALELLTSKEPSSHGGQKIIQPLLYCVADPDRIREVITNIFDNAVKYTEAGTITIGLTGDDRVVQFFVRDTGPGIPQDDIPHLFQKFYRVDMSATRTIGGSGLGLFICRKIIELYDGRIWVESEVDKGSTFYINIPRISADRARQLMAAEPTSVNPI